MEINMSRDTNEGLYVPYKKEEELRGYARFAEEHGAPPLKNLGFTALFTLGGLLILALILFITGLRLTTYETEDGRAFSYFGWINDGAPTFGTICLSDGRTVTVGGGGAVGSDGSVYTGEMKDLQKNGQGKLIFADGTSYTGQFKNDAYEGFGRLVYADGTSYEGEFSGGRFNGYGTVVYANGSSYTGEFENGEMSGNGIMTYYDGGRFEGSFKNGMRDTGTYTWTTGESISGIFKNNLPDPKEFISYTDFDGDTYYVMIKDGVITVRVSYVPKTDGEENTEDKDESENDSEKPSGDLAG